MLLVFTACSENVGAELPEQEEVSEVYLGAFSAFFNNTNNKGVLNKSGDVQPLQDINDGFSLMSLDDAQSTIKRTSNGVSVKFSAENYSFDAEGHAVTLWFVAIRAGEAFPYHVSNVGGHVIGKNGKINISGFVKKGDESNLFDVTDLPFDINGPKDFTNPDVDIASSALENPMTDSFLILTKTHGELDPGNVPMQLMDLYGGCEGDPDGAGPAAPCYEFLQAFHAGS
ncbi:hypothetical protein D3A96_04360 [Robertkochia marina]|nr:hypothetical protein D3A96_04360 [Robertkochia marina]